MKKIIPACAVLVLSLIIAIGSFTFLGPCVHEDGNVGCKFTVFQADSDLVKKDGNCFTFEATLAPQQAGAYKSAVRMYPKNKLLPHRQDFSYVKWLELPNY